MSYTHPDFKVIEKLFTVNKWLHPRLDGFSFEISESIRSHVTFSDIETPTDKQLDQVKKDIIRSKQTILNELSERVFKDTLNVLNSHYKEYVSDYTKVDFMGQPVKAAYGPNVLVKTENTYQTQDNVFSGINQGYRLLSIHELLCKAISGWTHHSYIIDDLPTFKSIPFIFSYDIEEFPESDSVDHKIINKAMGSFDREELKEHILQKIEANESVEGKESFKRFENIIVLANDIVRSNITRIENVKNSISDHIDAYFKEIFAEKELDEKVNDKVSEIEDWNKRMMERAGKLFDIEMRISNAFPEQKFDKSSKRLLGDTSYNSNNIKKMFINKFVRRGSWFNDLDMISVITNKLIEKLEGLNDEQTIMLNQFARLSNLYYNTDIKPKVYLLHEDGSHNEIKELSDLIHKIFQDNYMLEPEDVDTIIDCYSNDGVIGTFPEEIKKAELLEIGSGISKFV